MAEMTVNHPHKLTKAPAGSVRDFCASDAALVLRNVTAARAILRAVALAARAQFEGSIEYANNKPDRWQPAVDAACVRLQAVRDVLMETRSAPNVDWFTSLALVEALGAALWYGNSCSQGKQLEEVELESVAEAAIETIDSLMEDCAASGVFEIANAAKTAGLH
jgi:hypothetical protein